MKKLLRQLLLMMTVAVVVAMALTGCRREKQAESKQITTFRTVPTVTVSDLSHQKVPKGTSDSMLMRKGYMSSYNKQRKTPNWVAWVLTKEHTYGRLLRDNERFEEDTDVAAPRATYQDYYNSRYDRGHMCPAGDNKWDEEAMKQTFLMTNICPQNHGLNKEDWNELEMQCRDWARRWGEIVIACGPIYQDEASSQRYIGKNRVAVPSAFFKVVYRPRPEPLAIGFIFKNNGSSQPWRTKAVSVDEVERITGIDFFHRLPDDLENRVEAQYLLSEW